MIETIRFEDEVYPSFQQDGFAAQYAFPFAQKVLTGAVIYDIGYGRKEWQFPHSIGIDKNSEDERLRDAANLPELMIDGIFSSHCLEHIPEWVKTLDHWTSRLKKGGVLFLYLPDYSQKYWRPWNNKKHCNILTPKIMFDYMAQAGYNNKKIFVSGVDLYHSFMIMGERI